LQLQLIIHIEYIEKTQRSWKFEKPNEIRPVVELHHQDELPQFCQLTTFLGQHNPLGSRCDPFTWSHQPCQIAWGRLYFDGSKTRKIKACGENLLFSPLLKNV
jgi:hypothetical protein